MHQPGILAPPPPHACFLWLQRRAGTNTLDALTALGRMDLDGIGVVGLGPSLVRAAGTTVPGLVGLPTLDGIHQPNPHTPTDVWLRIDGQDPGQVLHRVRRVL